MSGDIKSPKSLFHRVEYQSLDGTGNNPFHNKWGSVGSDLRRKGPAQYGDGISTPAGQNRPSAREISNAVSAHPADETPNDRGMSDMVYVWGQFIDHDLDLTGGGKAKEKLPIPVPKGDPQFDPTGTGTQTIPLTRSEFDPKTGTSKDNPRQQVNQITAFLDGSMVYGSDKARSDALRSHEGGKLKTSEGNLLPLNTMGLSNANDAHRVSDDQLFAAGDVRANENPELTAMQTLFMREHNRIADGLKAKHPTWSDEKLFQTARKQVQGELQAITYNEFLPALLGKNPLPKYQGYNPFVNPGISNEFSTAGFRLGHSMLGDDIELTDNDGNELPGMSLADGFFNPDVVKKNGIGSLLKGSAGGTAEEVDPIAVDSVRNFLFGPPGAGGLDLVSLNIQRGREHGLADYNTLRASYGLPKVKSFEQITSNPDLQKKLKDLYGSVDNIDAWVGALSEDHVKGSSTGALDRAILVDQFARLRDGDRFFYKNQFSGAELKKIDSTKLSDIIKRNTEISNIQDNVFFAPEETK
ncbi:MAG TPA: peroxidase family protein [Myxococcaceae bacterium]|nr:peroxidase family protein [Myxococcaceae bacterium]